MPVCCYELGILFLDDIPVRIRAECPNKVIIPPGVDMELRIAVDAGDRIHYDRGHLDTHANIETAVAGSDAVLVHNLVHPARTDPARRHDHIS